MNFRKPLIYSTKYLVYTLLSPLYFLPESALKVWIRKKILKFQNSVPVFLAVNRGDIAVQVGTPSPLTVAKFSHSVGPNGKAVIVEADNANQETLRKTIRELKHQNTLLISKGAWSKKDTLKLYLSDDFTGDHKIEVDGISYDGDVRNEYAEYFVIEVDNLSNLLQLEGINKIDYLSVTVNGAELEVLRGAKELIQNSPSCRVFSKGHSLNSNGEALNIEISSFLQELGMETIISQGETPSDPGFAKRAGDVFAWKSKT